MSIIKTRPQKRFTILLISNLLILAALACSLPGLFGGATPTPTLTEGPTGTPLPPTPTPMPLPPAVVESDPPQGSELPLNGPVTIYFNQPMDRSSVEAALEEQPSMGGSFSWVDDATVTYKPGAALEPDSELTLSLNTGARSAGGLALIQPVSLNYRTAGYLNLTQSLPEPGANEVDPASAVVAAFNHPVVPLGADPASLPAGFHLEPAAQGRSEWLNTSTYIFYPEPPLEGGKTYQVQMNPDLHGTDGSPLESSDGWSFTTADPRLVSVKPEAGAISVRLDTQIVLTFNQPMDDSNVSANFSLLGPDSQPVAGAIEWNEDFTVVTFKPQNLLARNTAYTVSLTDQAQARGGTPLAAPLNAVFRTVPDLAVVKSEPAQGGQKQLYGGVTLYFSGPIVEKDILQYVTISPAVPNLNYGWNEEPLMLSLYGDFDPAAEYTLRLSSGMPDPWGGTLGQDYLLTFTTAPLAPDLFITSGTDVLYLTSQDSSLTVQATNLSNVPLSMGSVRLDDFFTMLGQNGYEFRNNFRSNDQRDWQQALDLAPNRTQPADLFVSRDQNPLKPGLYYLRYRLPQQTRTPLLLVVSDIQITFKLSATDALVWAVDLRNNSPLGGAPVVLYDENGSLLAEGQTDSDGIFQTSIAPLENPYSTYYAVISQPGGADFGLALSNWSQGLSSWDFGISSDFTPPHLKAYFYTDRPIYRPGQTVYFRVIARQAYNGRYKMPELSGLPVTLYGDMGQELENFDLPLSAFASGHGQYTIPSDAAPGYYRLSSNAAQYDGLSFQVADYRKPEINLQVAFNAGQALAGDKLTADVNTRYFFDAPAGDLAVHWGLYAAPSSFNLPGYQVGVEDTRWLDAFYFPSYGGSLGTLIEEGDGRTDAQGKLVLEFPTESDQSRQNYTLEVTAQDESGLPVSARGSIQVNPAAYYIGVRPDNWVGQADSEAGFDVQVVDWDKNPAGMHSLKAEFQKVVWVQDESQPSDRFMGPKFKAQYTSVASTDFNTDDQGQARIAFTPPEPGTYQINIDGDGAHTETLFWVGGPGQAVWPNIPNQRLRLTADRDKYQPGDTAKVFVPNPFAANTLALVTVERGVVLRHQVLNLNPGGNTLDFPFSAEDAPNVYVSVTLLGRNELGRPDFRQGYLNLPVEPLEQTLNVKLTSQPQRAGPGEDVTFEVQVTDSNGKPVQGEFSLSVVDLAVLALADPNSEDILPAFYGNQPLGIRTGLDLAAYAHRSSFAAPGMGGGGGEAVPSVVRENFPDTAYWNAEIVTDASGRAQVSMTLPDSLTTWQVDVRGLAGDTQVGQAGSQIVTTKDLLVRPVAPRFLVLDDHTQLAAVVQNNTQKDLQVQVSLQTSGFALDNPGEGVQNVSVPAGGRTRVEWWGTAQDVESADLVFSAKAGDLQDASRPSQGALPVLHYTAPQTYVTSGVMDEAGQQLELVSLPRSYDPRGGNLRLELASSLGSALVNGLDVLEHYPYECTEQTISRFLPNLETYRAMQQLGIEAPALKARLDRTLQDGIQRLLASQNTDGGWGWWPLNSQIVTTNSDPFITAYVLFGFSRAGDAGFSINPDVIQHAIDFLRAGLPTPEMLAGSSPEDDWRLDRLVFEHFALAQAGAGDLSAAESIFEVRDQLNPWAQALLALTLENLSPGSDQANTLISDLESTALRSAAGAHWEDKAQSWHNMSTPISTSSIVLYALAQRDPASPLLADSVRYLMAHRKANGAWDSTFSTAWTIMSMVEVMQGTGELGGSFTFEAALNGAPLASGQAGGSDQLTPVTANIPLSGLYPEDPNALIIQREAGPGRLYYSAALNVDRPVDSVPALSQGISISRAYFPSGDLCTKAECEPVQGARPGDRINVRLSLTLENAAYYLMVEDYLPAGAEILDTSLKTSQQGPEVPLFDPRKPFENGWGWWYFNTPRIYDDHIAWSVDYLPAGTYQLTYTLVILQSGQYRVLPARAWQFYFPDVQGTSPGELFEIKP
jgi:uncharacterized protein YfaS (alpha-2-macroglobulin family)